jgi:hypothetical protein
MSKVVAFGGSHSKKSDEFVASQLSERKFEAYFMELSPGVIEELGMHPSIEKSYTFAKNNNIPIHFVDDNVELLTKNTEVDGRADRIAFSLMKYHLRNNGFSVNNMKYYKYIMPIHDIKNETELTETVNKLIESYKESENYIRERSAVMAKNTDNEITNKKYSLSAIAFGKAHKDVADILKEKHDVELILYNDNSYEGASIQANRELRELCEINGIELPGDIRDNIFERRKNDIKTYMKFVEQKMPFETMKGALSKIYLE